MHVPWSFETTQWFELTKRDEYPENFQTSDLPQITIIQVNNEISHWKIRPVDGVKELFQLLDTRFRWALQLPPSKYWIISRPFVDLAVAVDQDIAEIVNFKHAELFLLCEPLKVFCIKCQTSVSKVTVFIFFDMTPWVEQVLFI